ncbi:type II toxin-antitoxin system Phd/YefM family antitoxin [Acidithiobacillus sp.]
MSAWQLQEAKAKLSELVKVVEREGPQEITVHGRPVAVVLSKADYERLSGTSHSLVAFMRASPLYGLEDIRFERDQSLSREVAF